MLTYNNKHIYISIYWWRNLPYWWMSFSFSHKNILSENMKGVWLWTEHHTTFVYKCENHVAEVHLVAWIKRDCAMSETLVEFRCSGTHWHCNRKGCKLQGKNTSLPNLLNIFGKCTICNTYDYMYIYHLYYELWMCWQL